jgi:hypothetical protein
MPTTARLALIVGGAAAYLGLAILGWGGFAAFFSHPALTALAIAFFAVSGAALFAGGNLSPGEREDRTNRWVIVAFGAIGLLQAYLPAYADRKEFWTIDGDGVRWLGVVLFAAGGALRLWPVFVLGNRFSGLVAGPAGQFARMGARFPLRGRFGAHRPDRPAAVGAHPRRGKAAALAIRRGLRYLPRPDLTVDPGPLLRFAREVGAGEKRLCRRCSRCQWCRNRRRAAIRRQDCGDAWTG